MRTAGLTFLSLFLVPTASGAETPSYARHIRPFFTRYCVECHPGKEPDGGLSLDTYKGLRTGGEHGPAIVPGKPDESRLILMVEGKGTPKMPPKRAKQPPKADLALLRAWIAAGATDDSTAAAVSLPAIAPRRAVAAPVTALAYQPGGNTLAAGVQRDVLFIDLKSGEVRGSLPAQTGRVSAVAFNRSGQHLAVASGTVGSAGEVRLFTADKENGVPASPHALLKGHTDVIYALAFSPDGKVLASTGYDRLVKLWDVATGKLLRNLADHSDAVYGVAFSPDGKLLATAGADRAVKIWDPATGTRLYTLSESTDWVYAVAFSPDGRHVAAGGVDRSIRVWEVDRNGGRVVHSVFAHEGPINRLIYADDGKTLYSLSEGGRCKAWEAGRMVERKVYEGQGDVPLCLAIRNTPAGGQLAIGRFDGTLVLLDEKTGRSQGQPLPAKPKPPVLKKLTPASGVRGKPVRVAVEMSGTQPVAIVANHPGVKAEPLSGSAVFSITFPADTPAGVYPLRLKNEAGESAPLPFTVDLFPAVKEVEPNDSPRTAQAVTLPATLVGSVERAGQVDYFRFEAKPGQQVGAQVQMPAGAKLEPVLSLIDPEGQLAVESTSSVLGHTCARAGTYALGVRDRDYRGGLAYRLHVGEVPVVTAIFPLGVQRGREAEVKVEGVFLGDVKSVRVKVPANAAPGTRVPLSLKTALGPPLGNPSVVAGEFPDVVAEQGKPTAELPIDGTANGRLLGAGVSDTWRFRAKKGERLLLEVNARRLGSPLDSFIEILDGQGNPLPRATLRCVARTYTTFRDHDSAGPGIRIEAWTELNVNDYLFVGSELLRIRALPRNPDDDCQFFSEGGRRRGFLGTTPNQLSLGTPMYKVTVHPPGATFPPTGLPLITLHHRNDDGGSRFGKDSRLTFDPPADGAYGVRISDARGQGGNQHAYRLTLRRPRPDFTVSFTPGSPSVWQGSAVPITVNVDRRDGFEDEIALEVKNLPAGFSAPVTNMPAGESSTAFALFAEPGAVSPAKGTPLKLIARARIAGKEVVREATGGLPKVVPAGNLVTTTAQAEVTVRPGRTVKLTVNIERRNGFKGRVPLDVRGLPHGVRVLDIGLNGILVTPAETSRTIAIYCEPWVTPMAHPIVVLARQESKNTEHAARSVLLKVVR